MDNFWNLTEMNIQMIFWGLIVVLSAIVEISTVALVSIWFVIGGIGAFIAAWYGCSFLIQLSIFVLTSVALFLLTRPMVKKINREYTPTNTDSLIGREALTVSEIDVIKGTGRALVDGQDWAAKSSNGKNIPENTVVIIDKIEGVTLFVSPKS